ncbi:MAG: substrate-binding domain-containing protein, partial [Desulfovibrionales bacterium]|nr:substrate-binding domain-containing protein [Desulfovibrionales bacterium]
QVAKQELPHVCIGDRRSDAFWVASDDEQGGYLATKHLLDNGCRTIYYVCPHKEHEVARLRQKGYCRAMHEAGLIAAEAVEIGVDMGLPALDSYRRIRGLMESGLRPDAFVAFSDIVATGICMALADTSKSVPNDVQVVGYDGIDNDRYRSLTTIRQDIEGLAAKTVELVMDAIQEKTPSGSYLDVILRQGHTTAALVTIPTQHNA